MLLSPVSRLIIREGDTDAIGDEPAVACTIAALSDEISQRFVDATAYAQGQSGTLFKASERHTGHRGILKMFFPVISDADSLKQSIKQSLVKQVGLSHPGLAQPLDVGEADGVLWFFRDWIDATSLRVRLSREGRISIREVIFQAIQVADSLDFLHQKGLIHGDLKPAHLLCFSLPDGLSQVTLIDAGVPSAPLGGTTQLTWVSTPEYTAPEVAAGGKPTFRSDLYALGCMLFEMLRGQPPFIGHARAVLDMHQNAPVPAPPTDVPAAMGALLVSLMAKEPRQRPLSAQQVRRALEAMGAAAGLLPTVDRDAELRRIARSSRPLRKRSITLRGFQTVSDVSALSGLQAGPLLSSLPPAAAAIAPRPQSRTPMPSPAVVQDVIEDIRVNSQELVLSNRPPPGVDTKPSTSTPQKDSSGSHPRLTTRHTAPPAQIFQHEARTSVFPAQRRWIAIGLSLLVVLTAVIWSLRSC